MGCGASQGASNYAPTKVQQHADPGDSGSSEEPAPAAVSPTSAEARRLEAAETGAAPAVESASADTTRCDTNVESYRSTSPASCQQSADQEPAAFEKGTHVRISGIENRPELNGQTGRIISFEGGSDRRYTVKVQGLSLRLRECKLSAVQAKRSPRSAGASQEPSPMPTFNSEHRAEVSPEKPADSNHGKFADFSQVLITGIEKRPELNNQIGLIISYDGGGDRRYTVRVSGSLVSLRESKLSAVPATDGAAHDDVLDWALDQCAEAAPASPSSSPAATMPVQAKMDASEQLPQGELTARGALIPTYHWVKVPAIASLPIGLEVWMPLNGVKCARIPPSWRLQVIAEGQVDAYRCDVGENSCLRDVLEGAAASFGWQAAGVQLCVDGQVVELEEGATVGSASLFGHKVTARRRQQD
eukprot:TRINITY_DN94772_c0_g1_i1.p1 TRINITY_DN94772_c0_g1~~TRINITY_DN94772_c0_g1_i1.p1  ORF type:complete len:416 (-),score=84.19 TRINITY_DN94772_c0_g1_i1:92-1339(-)